MGPTTLCSEVLLTNLLFRWACCTVLTQLSKPQGVYKDPLVPQEISDEKMLDLSVYDLLTMSN